MMGVELVVMSGLMMVKSASLVSLVVCLEGIVLVFLVCLISGEWMYGNLEVMVLGGVVVSIVVVSVVLSVYVVSVRGFGESSVLVCSMGEW
uniref:NADH dehydrogenase subunit 4L n=1 Tax=Centrorhynchus aluconis TaxID=1795424 RepID=A0A140DJ64_9BILA|nr:NADH dehydrogenase subunit 4L [Centrorhynchus aluconis]